MSKSKTLTARAMEHKRDAYTERICHMPPTLAHVWEREAERLLTLPGLPDVGPGGRSSPPARAARGLRHADRE